MRRRRPYLVALAALVGLIACCATGFWILRILPAENDPGLPPELRVLSGKRVGRYVTRVADIPASAAAAAAGKLGWDTLDMADAGEDWNATDWARRDLPFERLVWAVDVSGYYVLHYESGGIGHSWHTMILGLERNGRREPLWSGLSDRPFISVYTFVRAVKSDPALSETTPLAEK